MAVEIAMWSGADPGGKDRFGVALLRTDGTFQTRCVSCADQAKDSLFEMAAPLSESVLGLGIDCPLWWSSGTSGDRRCDQRLRRGYRIAAGTVQASNSLKGAALVQGVMLAMRMRERPGMIPITEAHPKALLKALKIARDDWNAIAARFRLVGDEPPDHELDAVLAAVAARAGFSGEWTCDLAEDRHSSELDPRSICYGPVRYWWPEQPPEPERRRQS